MLCPGQTPPGMSYIQFPSSQFIFSDRGSLDMEHAVVLTIEEAKGLEFDLVFLVDFFGDSTYGRCPGNKSTAGLVPLPVQRPESSNNKPESDCIIFRSSDYVSVCVLSLFLSLPPPFFAGLHLQKVCYLFISFPPPFAGLHFLKVCSGES